MECKLANVPIISNEEKLDLEIYAKRCFQNRNERLSRSTAYMIRKAQFPPEDDTHSDDMDEKEDEYANETDVPIMSSEKNLDLEIYANRCFQRRGAALSRNTEFRIPQAQFRPEDNKHSDDTDEKEDEYANETNQRKLFHKHLKSLSTRRKKMARQDNKKQYTSV